MLKMSKLRIALMNQAQTVMGMFGRVIPSVRSCKVVVVKLTALSRAESAKIDALTSQRLMPAAVATNEDVMIPSQEATIIQKERRLSEGKAISRAPICSGRRKLPKASCGAAVSTKKIINDP
jgi:hypothetical protein